MIKDKTINSFTKTDLVYLLVSGVLLVYILLRAYYVDIIYDEGFSYEMIKGELYPLFDANTHVLNTFLAFISSFIFSHSELGLRIPNILCFLLYAYFCYKLVVENSGSKLATILGATFLLCNHFLLEYFGLMRGYGMATAFLVGSIYYFLKAVEEDQPSYFPKAILFSVLTIYANYSFLTPLLALHLVYFYTIFSSGKLITQFKYFLKFSLIELAALLPGIIHLVIMIKKGRLYIGGKSFSETFSSVYDFSIQSDFFSLQQVSVYIITASLLLIGGYLSFKDKRLFYINFTILLILALIITLNFTIGMNFPTERAALYWIPMLGVSLFLTLEKLFENHINLLSYGTHILAIILVGLITISSAQTANLTHKYGSEKDHSETRSMLKLLSERIEPGKTYDLGVHWRYQFAIKYYKQRYNYEWLKLSVFMDTPEFEQDFLYICQRRNDIANIKTCIKTIKKYEIAENILFENCEPKLSSK